MDTKFHVGHDGWLGIDVNFTEEVTKKLMTNILRKL